MTKLLYNQLSSIITVSHLTISSVLKLKIAITHVANVNNNNRYHIVGIEIVEIVREQYIEVTLELQGNLLKLTIMLLLILVMDVWEQKQQNGEHKTKPNYLRSGEWGEISLFK